MGLVRGKESTNWDQEHDRDKDSVTRGLDRAQTVKIKDPSVLKELQISRVQVENGTQWLNTSTSKSFFQEYLQPCLVLATVQQLLSQTKGAVREDHRRRNGVQQDPKFLAKDSAPLLLESREDVDSTIGEVKGLIHHLLSQLNKQQELKPQQLAHMSELADRAADLLRRSPNLVAMHPYEETLEVPTEVENILPAPQPPRRKLRFSGPVQM